MRRYDITLSVWFDDEEFVGGDWSSTHMVFRNLNGASFEEGQASVISNYTSTHEQYLANVADMTDIPLVAGTLITLRSRDGTRVFLEHRLGVDSKGVTRPGEHYDDYAGELYQEGA